ncbi:MAG: UvrD-helicase domain-containing protein, partial [Gemmatimonadales bacterium]
IARDPEVGPDRILAITFTRRAAAEMKERAIRIFEASGETALRRATEAAYISTIHGFAERILRERPFDARIDPAFTVITEYEQKLWIEDALHTMYERTDLREFAQRLGKSFEGGWSIFTLVREVARLMREGSSASRREADMIGDGDRTVALALARARETVAVAEREMLAHMRAVEPLLDDAEFTSKKAMYDQSRLYLDAVRTCLCSNSCGAVPAECWTATRFTGQIEEGQREAVKELVHAIKRVHAKATFNDWPAQEALERELLPLKRAIYSAAAEVDRSYAEHKRAIGALDFHDLQLRAAALLAGNPAVRAEYAERFRHILLDESQDTDELQFQIVESLRTPANTLFMVGDPKQAIYEFRGANPDVFLGAMSKLPHADQLQLAENFRSRPEIVAMINGVGHALLPAHFAEIDARADYAGEWLDAPAVSTIYSVQQQSSDDPRKFEPLSAARPREAAAVAEELARLLHDHARARDPEKRELTWTTISPKHIAILFRTRTAIPYFERALADRGIPYVTASGQGFYERAEVLDCVMMLRAIAQPLDDLALAAILRSPFVGATDADLWRLRAPVAGNALPMWIALQTYAPLADFRTAFASLRTRVRGLPAAEALDDAIRTFVYEASLAAHQDGPAMLGNLAKLRRQLREMGSASALEAFAELQRSRELLTEESTAPLVGNADDVVVLTTIHQAKGLEWPVVCLPNLQSGKRGNALQFSPRHGALLCAALDEAGNEVRPMSLAPIIEEMKERAEAEDRRLLYVALTRARERLILSACVKESVAEAKEWTPDGKSFTPLAFLQASAADALASEGERECEGYRSKVTYVREPVVARTMYGDGKPLAATWSPPLGDAAHQAAQLPVVATPLSLKVTELLEYRRCPQVYRFSQSLDIREHARHRASIRAGGAAESLPSPVELGTRVHALLERIRFDAGDTGAEIARVLAGEDAKAQPAFARMLGAVLGGEIGDAVRSARRVEREWPFAMRVGGAMVAGVIDLAIQGQDGAWTVVDYKSNDFSGTGRFEYLAEYYAPQLELYAMALSRAGIGTVSDCALLFLTGPRVHRWSFDAERQDIGRWSESTVAKIAAADYATSAGPKCDHCGYRKRKICDVGKSWVPGGESARVAASIAPRAVNS